MTRHNFWPEVIDHVSEQLSKFAKKKIPVSLRKMFYTLLSLNIIPNTKSMYTQLSKKTAEAREAGIIPIDCFYDDYTIINVENEKYKSPEEHINDHFKALKELPKKYPGLPKWYNQPAYVEIWIEKNAMVPEFKNIIDSEQLSVRLVPHGGYVSLTQLNDSIQRIYRIAWEGKKEIHILYFGDFDPSGKDMFRDIKDRLVRIWGFENGEISRTLTNDKKESRDVQFIFTFERVAVNEDHLTKYPDLPSEPTDEKQIDKLQGDRRYDKFVKEHGLVAIELDALPIYIENEFKSMVIDSVKQYFDEDIYQAELADFVKQHSQKAIKALVRRKVKILATEL